MNDQLEQAASNPAFMLKVADAAEYVGVTTKTIRRWISSGHLPASRLGPKLIRIRRADLDACLGVIEPAPVYSAA